MAQISYIKYTDVLEARRYDAEFFKPEYLKIQKKLNRESKTLKDFEVKIFHPNEIKREYVEKDGVLFVRTQNVRPLKFDLTNEVYISKKDASRLKKNLISKKDVLMSRTGANFGQCCLFYEDIEAIASSHTFIIKHGLLNPFFLSIFFNTNHGRKMIDKGMYGGLQPEITPNFLLKIPFFEFPQSFQFHIEEIVKSAHQKQTQSKQLYCEAEELLLQELGLLNYQVKHSLWFATTKNEVSEAHRYDSEYFQPKYAEIIKKIENYEGGWDFAGELVKWKKGVEVGTEAYTETGKYFVRVSDFTVYGLSESNRKISDEAFEELKKNYQPKQGEILFTKDGTIGISYVLKEDIQGVLSGAFLRLTLKEKYQNFEKECLSLIFSSILCKMQVEKLSGGALIAHLKPSDFETFKIPLIKQSIQKQIAEKIQKSHELRKESKQLLEEAKRMVEEEIEK